MFHIQYGALPRRISLITLLVIGLLQTLLVSAVTISWKPCPIQTFSTAQASTSRHRLRVLSVYREPDQLFVEQANGAECGTADLPLDHSAPGSTIQVFVKKVPPLASSASTPKGQLWIFGGGLVGPGFGGITQEELVSQLRSKGAPQDIYVVDYRGTGRSSRLSCPGVEDANKGRVTQSQVLACWAEVQKTWTNQQLAQFSTTNTAKDIHELMLGAPVTTGQKRYIYAAGYGSFLANRFLSLFPNAAEHVILDNVCPPGLCRLDQVDAQVNAAGIEYLNRCKNDEFCTSKLGGDPVTFMRNLENKMRTQGHCSESGISADQFAQLNWLFMNEFWTRMYTTATAYRLNRCAKDDLKALTHLMTIAIGPEPEPKGGAEQRKYAYSEALHRNIAYSELWQTIPQSEREFNATETAYLFTSSTTKTLFEHQGQFPTFSDPSLSTVATTTAEVVVLAGDLDQYSPVPFAERFEREMRASKLTLIVLANGAHETVFRTPMNGRSSYDSCGLEILLSILKSSEGKPDVKCTRSLYPLDYRGEPGFNKNVYGTTDAYEGISSAHSVRPSLLVSLAALVSGLVFIIA